VSRRPALTSLLGAALLAGLLSGCGTGLHARTYQEIGRQDGATANLGGAGGIAVRHLHVSPPPTGGAHPLGGTAFVTGGLVNNGTSGDALVSASSAVAGAATLLVDGTPTTEVAVPRLGAAPSTWTIALSGLNRTVSAATYIPVTLEFQRAGRVTLQVPVEPGDNGLDGRQAAQDPYSTE
jgi:copper(I)-binding protein